MRCIDLGAGGMCGLLKDEPANLALAKDLHQLGHRNHRLSTDNM